MVRFVLGYAPFRHIDTDWDRVPFHRNRRQRLEMDTDFRLGIGGAVTEKVQIKLDGGEFI